MSWSESSGGQVAHTQPATKSPSPQSPIAKRRFVEGARCGLGGSRNDGFGGSASGTSGPMGAAGCLGDPLRLAADAAKAEEVVARLDGGGHAERRRLVAWLLGVVPALALSRHGCWVVQKALEVSDAPDRNALLARLEASVGDLYRSKHGNFVLTRLIELVPSASVGFVLAALEGQGAEAARNRFGCRVLEQLLAHCSASQLDGLVAEVVEEADDLAQHPFGNFVVQAMLEYGPVVGRCRLLGALLPNVPLFASHRVASHVVQKAIRWSGAEGQQLIIECLLSAQSPHSLIDIACCRSGSFTVAELSASWRLSSPGRGHGGGDHSDVVSAFRAALLSGLPRLRVSKHGQRVADCFGLEAEALSVTAAQPPLVSPCSSSWLCAPPGVATCGMPMPCAGASFATGFAVVRAMPMPPPVPCAAVA